MVGSFKNSNSLIFSNGVSSALLTCIANVPIFYHAYKSVLPFLLLVGNSYSLYSQNSWLQLFRVVVLNLICFGIILLTVSFIVYKKKTYE